MTHGYHGKILHVDLTKGKFEVEEPGEAFYRKYLGGSALAMHYLLQDMAPGVDPCSGAQCSNWSRYLRSKQGDNNGKITLDRSNR